MDLDLNLRNKVAESGIVSVDLSKFYPTGERILYDIKDNLFQGLILREKDFREYVKLHDWAAYQGKHVAIYCSVDAIVPTWAYMLLATKLSPYAASVIFGDLNLLETVLFDRALASLDLESYRDQRVVVKGCGEIPVPDSAYVSLAAKLVSVAKSVMYGEPCSTVPLFKKKDV